jgi:hypothetical protein
MKHKTNRHEKIIKKNVISPHAIEYAAQTTVAAAAKMAKT